MDAENTGSRNSQAPRGPAPPPDANSRLEAILRVLPDLLFVIDREGLIYEYHSAADDQLYLPAERFLGRKVADVMPEPAAGLILGALKTAAERGPRQSVVYPLPYPDGERWFEASIAVQGDPRTPEGRLVFLARDVTERKQSEEALRDSEEKYRLLTEGMKDVVWVLDVEAQRFTYVSPSVKELRGYTAEEILAQPLAEAWVPEEREKLFTLMQGYVADFFAGKIDENTYVPIEFLQPCKDGSTVCSEAVCRLLRNARTGRLELHGVTRDITRRVQAENAFRASENRFNNVAQTSRSYAWEVDADGRLTYVSPVVADVLGYRPEEIVGKMHFWDFYPPETAEKAKEASLRIFRAARPVAGFENPNRTKDGRVVWVSSSATPLFRADGTLRGYQGVDIDVTARKQAEEALRESETRFGQSAQQSRTYLWEVDAEGRYTFASHVVEDVLGYRPDEIVGKLHFYDLFPEEIRAALRAEIASAIQRRQSFRDYENPCQAKDGRIVWVITSAIPLLNPDGSLRGYRGSDTDITPRKRMEETLRESEARFAQTARQSRAFVWEVDAEGRYMFVTPVVEDVLGYRPDELAGHLHFYDLHPEEGREAFRAAAFDVVRRRGEFRDFENPMVAKDDRAIWVSTNAFPLLDKDGALLGYRGIDLDVTERKQAQDALQESEARARAIHDNLPGGLVYQVDTGADGRQRIVTFMSKGAEQLHGVPAAEIMRDSSVFYRQFVEEDLPRVAELEAQAIATMSPFQAEARIRLPSGQIRWRLFASAPRRQPNGHLLWDGIELDVTERKQAEDARRESELRLRTLNDNLPGGLVYQMDTGVDGRERRLLAISKGVERMHGVTVAEALSHQKTFYLQIVPEDQARVAELEARAIAALTPFRAEVRCRMPTGEIRWIYVSSAPRRLPNGHVVWDGIELDVTEKRLAEEALAHSEAKYRQLYESMRDPIASSDLKGRLLDFNPAFADLLGYARDELLGMNFRTFTPRKWHAAERKIVAEQVRKRGYSSVYEKEYVRKNGSVIPVELRTMLVCDAGGNPTGLSAIVRDISERKRAEQALREAHDELERRVQERTAELVASQQALAQSEEQFRQMAENVQEAFWLIDVRTLQALYVSPTFKKIWNWPVEKIVTHWFAHIHPEDRERVVRAFQNGMKTGIPGTIVYRILWPDGSIRWIESFGSMIRDARGRPSRAVGMHRDVTEHRRLESEILNAGEAERQRIGRDLHDSLGQSLTAIGYLADAVREDLARAKRPEAADVRKLGRLIEKTASQSHALARGLLLADLKRGGLGAALQELAFLTQELFGGVCRYSGPATLPPLDANAVGQLYRIAQEAVTNAAKHGQAQRIDVRLAKNKKGLLLSVRDTGKGFSAGKRKRAGLGLDIMRYRADMIGATLEVDSARNQGTTVNCLLPLAAPAPKRKK